jgi:hypothetical protein
MTDNPHADAGYDTKRTSTRTPTDRPSRGRRRGGTASEDPDSGRDDERTMGDVSHTNPHTGESFGDTVTYDRGPTVVVDGGEAEAVPESDGDADEEQETMGDIAHTPPNDAPDPNAVHMRGGEGAEDEDEE